MFFYGWEKVGPYIVFCGVVFFVVPSFKFGGFLEPFWRFWNLKCALLFRFVQEYLKYWIQDQEGPLETLETANTRWNNQIWKSWILIYTQHDHFGGPNGTPNDVSQLLICWSCERCICNSKQVYQLCSLNWPSCESFTSIYMTICYYT